MIDDVRAIEWQGDVLLLLDQRQLPKKTIYLEIDSVDAAIASIKALVVRGAPAIGITAAYAVVLAARSRYRESAERWRELIREDLIKLAAARPTAVNLSWALQRMQGIITRSMVILCRRYLVRPARSTRTTLRPTRPWGIMAQT